MWKTAFQPGSTVSGANHRSHAQPWVPIAPGTIFCPSHLRCLWLEPGGYGWGQVSGWPSGFIVAPRGRGGNVGSISGRAEAKGSGCPGENQWLMSLCSSSCSCWKSGSLGTLFLNDLLSNFGKPRSPSCGLGVWTSARCCSGRLPASLTPV